MNRQKKDPLAKAKLQLEKLAEQQQRKRGKPAENSEKQPRYKAGPGRPKKVRPIPENPGFAANPIDAAAAVIREKWAEKPEQGGEIAESQQGVSKMTQSEPEIPKTGSVSNLTQSLITADESVDKTRREARPWIFDPIKREKNSAQRFKNISEGLRHLLENGAAEHIASEMIRIALCSPSDSVRLQAMDSIADRVEGKAIQSVRTAVALDPGSIQAIADLAQRFMPSPMIIEGDCTRTLVQSDESTESRVDSKGDTSCDLQRVVQSR